MVIARLGIILRLAVAIHTHHSSLVLYYFFAPPGLSNLKGSGEVLGGKIPRAQYPNQNPTPNRPKPSQATRGLSSTPQLGYSRPDVARSRIA